ncbi:MAG TPA: hypothetical protein VET84_11165 [Stellaceae bacterium]|jgi:hypothetical protein|nr:hypothetical protein [Stellaceae bacterium]
MERETTIDRLARETIKVYGRSAGVIADQRAASYIATGDFGQSRAWLETAAVIRRLGMRPDAARRRVTLQPL